MIEEPTDAPVTRPEPLTMGATAVLLLLHAPSPTPSPNVVEYDTHTEVAPVMLVGDCSIVAVVVAKQPVVNV